MGTNIKDSFICFLENLIFIIFVIILSYIRLKFKLQKNLAVGVIWQLGSGFHLSHLVWIYHWGGLFTKAFFPFPFPLTQRWKVKTCLPFLLIIIKPHFYLLRLKRDQTELLWHRHFELTTRISNMPVLGYGRFIVSVRIVKSRLFDTHSGHYLGLVHCLYQVKKSEFGR